MVCYPRFEELKPLNEDQLEDWREPRAQCYKYSFTHFLNSIIHHRFREANFLLSCGDHWDLQRGQGDEVADTQIVVTPPE